MTAKTRNWLITLLILASPFLFFLGLLLFWTAEPLPPVAPLPNPNGYEDLVKAGRVIKSMAGYDQTNEQQLAELVATNAEALRLLRAGLSNQCRVPLQFSENYMTRHLNDLASFKRLAQILAAEGRLAGMEGRPADAAKSYLDAIRLGTESARGGIMIDELVGIAIEAIGTSCLQNTLKPARRQILSRVRRRFGSFGCPRTKLGGSHATGSTWSRADVSRMALRTCQIGGTQIR